MISLLEDIQNMTNLTNGLLELSQLSTSTFQPKFELVRVDELLWEMVDVVTNVKPNYKIAIEFGPETDENDLIVKGNQSWLGNCFKNLMENGCKFSSDHRVWVSLQPKKDWLVISFIDHGYGIASTELEHIFEPFYRSENTLHVPGHGIGLSLCHKIVQLHNGLIDVKSQIGVGTTFSVKLPLARSLA
jgi:signal transduction histidine kinase